MFPKKIILSVNSDQPSKHLAWAYSSIYFAVPFSEIFFATGISLVLISRPILIRPRLETKGEFYANIWGSFSSQLSKKTCSHKWNQIMELHANLYLDLCLKGINLGDVQKLNTQWEHVQIVRRKCNWKEINNEARKLHRVKIVTNN